MDELSGTITSPTSDNKYLHDLSCQWVIHAPPTKIIQINFITFSLEGADYADHCSFDYVEIYNAASGNDKTKQIGRLFEI